MNGIENISAIPAENFQVMKHVFSYLIRSTSDSGYSGYCILLPRK